MNLNKANIIKFLKGENEEQLFNSASTLRKKFFKNKILLKAIIGFSNYCLRDCLYCGLRRENSVNVCLVQLLDSL